MRKPTNLLTQQAQNWNEQNFGSQANNLARGSFERDKAKVLTVNVR
jgi:hypothetical protein